MQNFHHFGEHFKVVVEDVNVKIFRRNLNNTANIGANVLLNEISVKLILFVFLAKVLQDYITIFS